MFPWSKFYPAKALLLASVVELPDVVLLPGQYGSSFGRECNCLRVSNGINLPLNDGKIHIGKSRDDSSSVHFGKLISKFRQVAAEDFAFVTQPQRGEANSSN